MIAVFREAMSDLAACRVGYLERFIVASVILGILLPLWVAFWILGWELEEKA